MAEDSKVVIVGAGHGGGNLCSALRQAGHTGPITLIGDEPHLPYHRPPLSKAYLKGSAGPETLPLRAADYYEGAGIELRLGRTATSVDPAGRTVTLDDGAVIRFEKLVLATGSRARRLTIAGAELPGIFHLRDRADADAIRTALRPGSTLAIVGGGYIGLEVAASAIALGAKPILLERESRILARVACEPLAGFFDAFHRAQGVDIRTGVDIAGFEGAGHVTGVRLADGSVIACDAVLVGVGAQLCDGLAREAGVPCEAGGVVVDDEGRTGAPGVYAIGDMSWRPMPLYGGRMFRLESVPNAIEQGRRVAADIVGKPAPAHEVPWFWSDQYDRKLQIAGVPFDSHRLVIRGSIEDAKFAIFHLSEENRVLAVEAVNMPGEFMAGRALVGSARVIDPTRLADPATLIKEIVRAS